MMATRRNKKRFFPRKPLLLLRRHLLLLSLAAFAVSLLSLVILLRSASSSSPPPHCGAASVGEFGDMMLSMLPKNLPFTVFVPSPKAFRRVLRLPANDSTGKEEADHTYAVVSRVLGFSAIPQRLRSLDVPLRRQVSLLNSVSGLKLHAWRDVDGALVVNGVRSECVDIDRAEAILHVMAGVVMDTEFELSFYSELDE